MKILISKYLFTLFIFLTLFIRCTEQEPVLINEDLIFSNSYQIKISSYKYFDRRGKVFIVRGDTSYKSAYPDTLNSLPTLAWDSIGIKIISVAIFKSPIVIEENEIVNVADILWNWHSGMNFGKEGYVQYLDGKDVVNGEEVESVTPLAESTYYWGVWAWNSSGTRILYSSHQLEFYVRN